MCQAYQDEQELKPSRRHLRYVSKCQICEIQTQNILNNAIDNLDQERVQTLRARNATEPRFIVV